MTEFLNTIEFGRIRIADKNEINHRFDTYIDNDLAGEWEFWQIHDLDIEKDGEIVAVWIGDDDDTDIHHPYWAKEI